MVFGEERVVLFILSLIRRKNKHARMRTFLSIISAILQIFATQITLKTSKIQDVGTVIVYAVADDEQAL